MKLFKHVLGLVATLVFLSCTQNKEAAPAVPPDTVKPWSGPLAAGQINGQDWQYQSGSAHIVKHNFQIFLLIRLWGDKIADPCNEKEGSSQQVRLTAPKRLDSWKIEDPFESKFSIFFSDREVKPRPLDNLKADEGQITLMEISKTDVTGYFAASFTHPKVGVTEAQGGFTVPICEGETEMTDSFGDNFSP
jgi:hypothetical protein